MVSTSSIVTVLGLVGGPTPSSKRHSKQARCGFLTLAARLLVREVSLERCVLVPSRRSIPVARRTLGNSHLLTLQMRSNYAIGLCKDDGATLDDLREIVTTLDDTERIARRVLGGAHPTAVGIGRDLSVARKALDAVETLEAVETPTDDAVGARRRREARAALRALEKPPGVGVDDDDDDDEDGWETVSEEELVR